MRRSHNRSGQALVAIASLAALGGGLTFFAMKAEHRPGAVPATPLPATDAELDGRQIGAALRRAGIHPTLLAASGVANTSVAPMFAAVRTAEGDPASRLLDAEAAARAARDAVQRLARLASAGLASQEDIDALDAANAHFTAATSEANQWRTAVRSAASRQLSPEAASIFLAASAVDTNGLPVAYDLVITDQDDAVALRRALAAKRAAERWGEELPPAPVAIIAAANIAASSTGAAAQAHFASVTLAWNNAVE